MDNSSGHNLEFSPGIAENSFTRVEKIARSAIISPLQASSFISRLTETLERDLYTMPRSEREREIARRRHRKVKTKLLKARAAKASPSEKQAIAEKFRGLTPGAETIIKALDLESRN